jgi:aspartyl-tRNA(Asn)/glutamyl-tRNA(Gln) amidotransferase subunit A
LAVKDLFDTAGLTTTYGSAIFADHVPATTAGAVLRLEAAGYANVGKTNLHEFAYGITSENPHFGTVPNPFAPGRIAGGSSGGNAAALALGLVEMALGSDSGGSIRIPAACCGVVGFKPTFGLVPADGCFPLAPSFDHVGPMARTVADCEAAMAVLAPGFVSTSLSALDGVAVGVASAEEAEPLVRARFEEAAAHFDQGRRIELAYPFDTEPLFMHDVASVHRDLYTEHADLYGEEVAAKIERCLDVSDSAAATAARARDDYRTQVEELIQGLDLLLVPTLPYVAPPVGVGDRALRADMIRFTYPINVLGWPALALPCGLAEDGLPASIQIVGRPDADAFVLAVGKVLESLVRVTPERG